MSEPIVHPLAEAYAAEYTSPLPMPWQAIADDTYAHHKEPHMLSGHTQGQLLAFISGLIKPERILEIGTFTGFSAVCLASGLAENGILHTIELRPDDAALSKRNIEQAGLAHKVELHIGDAKEILKTLHHPWDIIFIDADKPSYIEYYELTLPYLKPGGLIIADNVLFHGEVYKNPVKGKNAIAMDLFNRHVASDNRVEQVMITHRDGLLFIRKKTV